MIMKQSSRLQEATFLKQFKIQYIIGVHKRR